MLSRAWRLVEPRVVEPAELACEVGPGDVVVRPERLSICNADARYYFGRRSPEALAAKLPMALIHEGVGRVAYDRSGAFEPGQRVVMVPNAPVESDPNVAENYLRSSLFAGSGSDGFMRELVVLPAGRALVLPAGVPGEVAAFTELVSVAVHAVARFLASAHAGRSEVGVWGDGNVGFIVALVLSRALPGARIHVVGRNPGKLADFTFAEAHLASDLPASLAVDHAFECCGGEGSAAAIAQIIDVVRPEGTVSLLGVSENPVPVNTRMVLEKGLRLVGSSRSGRADFERTLSLYREHPEVLDYLGALVGQVVDVSSVRDVARAFEADARKPMGKTIMEWNM